MDLFCQYASYIYQALRVRVESRYPVPVPSLPFQLEEVTVVGLGGRHK